MNPSQKTNYEMMANPAYHQDQSQKHVREEIYPFQFPSLNPNAKAFNFNPPNEAVETIETPVQVKVRELTADNQFLRTQVNQLQGQISQLMHQIETLTSLIQTRLPAQAVKATEQAVEQSAEPKRQIPSPIASPRSLISSVSTPRSVFEEPNAEVESLSQCLSSQEEEAFKRAMRELQFSDTESINQDEQHEESKRAGTEASISRVNSSKPTQEVHTPKTAQKVSSGVTETETIRRLMQQSDLAEVEQRRQAGPTRPSLSNRIQELEQQKQMWLQQEKHLKDLFARSKMTNPIYRAPQQYAPPAPQQYTQPAPQQVTQNVHPQQARLQNIHNTPQSHQNLPPRDDQSFRQNQRTGTDYQNLNSQNPKFGFGTVGRKR